MTFAWYAHLKNLSDRPWFIAALVSWGIALFDICKSRNYTTNDSLGSSRSFRDITLVVSSRSRLHKTALMDCGQRFALRGALHFRGYPGRRCLILPLVQPSSATSVHLPIRSSCPRRARTTSLGAVGRAVERNASGAAWTERRLTNCRVGERTARNRDSHHERWWPLDDRYGAWRDGARPAFDCRDVAEHCVRDEHRRFVAHLSHDGRRSQLVPPLRQHSQRARSSTRFGSGTRSMASRSAIRWTAAFSSSRRATAERRGRKFQPIGCQPRFPMRAPSRRVEAASPSTAAATHGSSPAVRRSRECFTPPIVVEAGR